MPIAQRIWLNFDVKITNFWTINPKWLELPPLIKSTPSLLPVLVLTTLLNRNDFRIDFLINFLLNRVAIDLKHFDIDYIKLFFASDERISIPDLRQFVG